MKKIRIVSALLMLALFAELLWWQYPVKIDTEEREAKRYVYIAPYGQVEFRELAARGILRADSEFMTETEFWACTDLESMSDAVYRSIYSSCDGIIFSGTGYSDAFAQSLHDAREAGIEVVMIDSKIEGLEYDHYLGIDNHAAGKTAADIMLQSDEYMSGDRAAVIISRSEAENQLERLNGFKDIWEDANGPGTVEVLEIQGEYLPLQEMLKELKQGDEPVRWFFCAEAISSVYMRDALEAADYTEAQVVAFDMLQQILENVDSGSYKAVIGQDMTDIGYRAVEFLQNESKEAYLEKDEMVTVNVIDSENVKEYLSPETEELVWNTI